MVDERCAGDPTPPPDTPTDNCALDETNKAREFMYVLCFPWNHFHEKLCAIDFTEKLSIFLFVKFPWNEFHEKFGEIDCTDKLSHFCYRKQIDEILSKNLFKPDMEEKCGKDTMIAYIDLKWVLT